MIKVLLATNNSVLERMVHVTLTINGLSVTSVPYLSDVITQLNTEDFNILLLDSLFADAGAIIRDKGYALPILALTAQPKACTVSDMGYLADPFDFSALKKKMSSLLKTRHTLEEKVIINGNLKIDLINQLVMIKDEMLKLGKIEFAILVSLARKMEKVVSKDKLRKDLEAQGCFFSTSIYHHIKELKRKLNNSENENLTIKFISCEGYRLQNG